MPSTWSTCRIVICAAVTTVVLAGAACDSPTAPAGDLDPADALPLVGGSTLVFENAATIAEQRGKIEQVVSDTIVAVRALMPVDGTTIIAGVGTANVIPEIGLGGRADAGTVRLTFDPASPALLTSLDVELFSVLAHELHHVARMRTVGYGNHLLGAVVSEGLADQFAVEVTGGAPPIWAVALSGDQLATWLGRAGEQWFDTGYDHAAWFFGNGGGIPRWAGYSIGFDLTGRYLLADPSRRASDLFDEPASSFVPDPAALR